MPKPRANSSSVHAFTRRRPRGEATRLDIVQVARWLFSEHGYHTTGIADIHKATGLTKGAFYHHFPTKADLALAVLDLAEREYAHCLFAPVMEKKNPGERLRAMLHQVLALNGRPEWCNCRMMMILAAELTPSDQRLRDRVLELHETMLATWRELIAAARDEGQVRQDVDPAVAAQWIAGTFLGLLVLRKADTPQFSPLDVIRMLEHSILGP
jgi:TetR/AcrR family transcriptional repressor of nem operon